MSADPEMKVLPESEKPPEFAGGLRSITYRVREVRPDFQHADMAWEFA
jgi:hypothetical protein